MFRFKRNNKNIFNNIIIEQVGSAGCTAAASLMVIIGKLCQNNEDMINYLKKYSGECTNRSWTDYEIEGKNWFSGHI